MFYYQTGSWVRINLVLSTNHLSFGYESSHIGYESSAATKSPWVRNVQVPTSVCMVETSSTKGEKGNCKMNRPQNFMNQYNA